jgi:alkanesulfonate monooxygenase
MEFDNIAVQTALDLRQWHAGGTRRVGAVRWRARGAEVERDRMTGARQIKLGAFLWPTGHHIAAWRHPGAPADAGVNFAHFVEVARTAERGLFDMLFFADQNAIFYDTRENLSRTAYLVRIEPFTLLSALATATRHIGLVCTATTTYDEPYHIARRFASLDLVSGGRSGWNVVTSANPAEARNFNREAHVEHDERYRRAWEFVDVVKGLWDSWDDDAFVRDKETGQYLDPDKMHELNHDGQYFRVRGPLNVARSPQGQPVIVQAGSSDAGRGLAAGVAEVVFTAHQSLADAQAFYDDIKARAARSGRNPDHVKVMPGIFVTVGRTEQEAREKYDVLQSLIDPRIALTHLSTFIKYDLSGHPFDGPVPDLPASVTVSSRPAMLLKFARQENLTIRQLAMHIAGSRGHWNLIGSPQQIADRLEEWFRKGGADGFNYMPPLLPGSLDDFVALVVPELQRRGLFRQSYEGCTLRDSLGIPYPQLRRRT